MKKILFAAIISAVTATSPLFAQHTQSLSLSNPGPLQSSGQMFNVSVDLTFSGYSSFGLSYWLEVPNALAPFLTLNSATRFTFPNINQPVNNAPFNSTLGATAGFMLETTDLGASVNDPNTKMLPPGTYHITDLTFTLAPGAPTGSFILRSTTVNTRVSEVIDTDMNNNPINPAGAVTLNIVPEPSTLALLTLGAIGAATQIYRRRRAIAHFNRSITSSIDQT